MWLVKQYNSQISLCEYRNVHLHSCYGFLQFGDSFDVSNVHNDPDEILGKRAHTVHIALFWGSTEFIADHKRGFLKRCEINRSQ